MTIHYDYYPELPKKELKLGEEPYLHKNVVLKDANIGAYTEIGRDSSIVESMIGDYSYTAGYNNIIYTDIGKFCSIASFVRINPGDHPMERVTQHHCTYRIKQYGFGEVDSEDFFDWRRSFRCVIGHDVWIGSQAIIMSGVEVGTGAVIGTGAVVTKNVKPYEVAVGVPAKPVKKRFSEEKIQQLIASQWWDWDRETLKQRFPDLYNTEKFLSRYAS